MELKNQFSKYAKEYKSYNIIQQICAKSLVRELKSKPKNILELGCGSGQIFSNVDWEFDKYLAIAKRVVALSQDLQNHNKNALNIEILYTGKINSDMVKIILGKNKFEMRKCEL